MLSKEKCIQAINVWKITRTDYSKVEKLISPVSVFSFDRTQIDWLNERNKNSKFHTYIGIYNEELILIVVPINEEGIELDLSEYMTCSLGPLESDLTLIETDVVTTVKKTTLSIDLSITSYHEEVILPTYNEPAITERASVDDIEKWKINCLDWFYCECNDFEGQRIFRTFTVPFSDLVKEDVQYNEVKAMFGLKYSTIYQRDIPILIFVAIDSSDKAHHKIIRSGSLNSESIMNTADLSRPCPPMCIDSKDYSLIY